MEIISAHEHYKKTDNSISKRKPIGNSQWSQKNGK